jgi:hypothetical protein
MTATQSATSQPMSWTCTVTDRYDLSGAWDMPNFARPTTETRLTTDDPNLPS